MTIQFTIPQEYVDAIKDVLKRVRPDVQTAPTDDDVTEYVIDLVWGNLNALAPEVATTGQATLKAQIAALEAQLKTSRRAALGITRVAEAR